MRHRGAPYLALALLGNAAPAEAKRFTFGTPQMTITVPGGWTAREARGRLVLTRGSRRLTGSVCPLLRARRKLSGVHIPGTVPVPGGSCLGLSGGRGAAAVLAKLKPVLGPGGRAPTSNAEAEQLAREARTRTLGRAYAIGTALGDGLIPASFEWSLPDRYVHQITRFGDVTAETIRQPGDDALREGKPCWETAVEAEDDDTLEPRLELREWDAPPSTTTAWRVSYAPPQALADGATKVTWTGFVADGEAVIGPDGLLRSVRISDHGQTIGRTSWRTVEVAFSGFPAGLELVRPEPRCS